jgi:signal peptide peptidase SppA
MKLSNTSAPLWYGTEDSFQAVLHAIEQLAALEAQGTDALKAAVIARGGDDDFGLPPMLQIHGNVGVVQVDGPLIAGSAGFLRLFGVVGYDDIKQALGDAVADSNVKSILLSIDSGGGQVNGVESAGDFIQAVDKIKPVVAHTDGLMASAAYWMGTSARNVYASKTSTVGSVGTLIMHMERSKQLEANGVTATIVRFGKFKALNNPVEPLSAEGKAQLQTLADDAGQIFVDYVAGRRGVTSAEFQKTMGEGRVFPGRKAADVGLTDGVMSLDQAMAHMKTLDTSSSAAHNSRSSTRGTHMKVAFAKKTILAIAAGTALDQLGLDAPEANAAGTKLEGDALAAFQTEAGEVKAAFDGAVKTAVEAATTDLNTKLTAATEASTKAAADLKTAQEELVIAKSAATDLNGKLTVSADLAAKASEIVKQSMSVMSVALGGAADVGASLTGTELLAEHARLAEQFQKKFPAGGVAAVNAAAKPTVAASAVSPQFLHLVQANAAK